MKFIEHIGYYGLHTLATPLLWWTITLVAVLLCFHFLPVKRPRIRYYTSLAVLLSLPVGIILTFMPSSVYTTVTAPDNMSWIASPEITVTGYSGESSSGSFTAAFWAGVVLLIASMIVVFSAIRFVISLINISTLKLTSVPVRNRKCNRLVCKLQQQLHISKPVQLLYHASLTSPVSFGWKNPVVVIPSDSISQSEEKLKPVLLHELHHIKHSDFIISMITECITSVLSFHPGALMLRSHLYRYQEMHCDAKVLGKNTCSSADYAQILLEYSCGPSNTTSRLACSMSRSQVQIRDRILMMNQYPDKEKLPDSHYNFFAPLIACSLFIVATVFTSCDLTPDQLEDETGVFEMDRSDDDPAPVDGLNSIISNLDVTPDDVEGDQIKVEVTVDQYGEISQTFVEKSMGDTFDQAFIEAMKESDWEPAKKDGEPVYGLTTIGINFESSDQNQEPEPVGGMDAIYDQLTYPEQARERGVDGVVLLEFVVDEEGELSDLEIVQSVGGGTSDAAKKAIENVDWEPGYEDGVPTNYTMQMPIRFQLSG